ncbi:glycosyltransferase [Flammeovirga yaeyamensis]|uniref:Glycosyltransferase n=1 Tax=Flammeovirga yaeyamensis TaxID=367791 RepID=A0AAX1MZR1_9BACT|nr:glycosyltransferase family 2 protein [Flammeovirga yaeyamensis]MBB3700321.1 glycosyltransferase involved in cell wall biosynthesis [Flammeovirga yaeyamensis]NMF37053.1 glycosyltransferase [Flammeovirga yaeyamensis]QWG00745.1 glycosyltransferase [Flammeovirga yaeyamensis]
MTKVSIITISWNCADEIEKTLQSVVAQDFEDKEYVVVDGNSKDNTLSIINKYKNDIVILVSEPDKGIYDAMNKGTQLASGEYVIFMNAGDQFYDPQTLSHFFEKVTDQPDLVYGDHEVVYDHFVKIKKGGKPEDLWKGMICSHQAIFVKRQLLLDHPFDWNNWKISADFHFIYNRFIDGCSFQHIPINVAKYASGGLSETSSVPSKLETWAIVKEHNSSPEVDAFYSKLIRYEKLVNIPRKLLGPKAFEVMMKVKNKVMGKEVR